VHFFKRFHEALFWSDVQDIQWMLEKVGSFLKEKPDESVPLQ